MYGKKQFRYWPISTSSLFMQTFYFIFIQFFLQFSQGAEGGWRKHYNYRCQPVDYSTNPRAIRVIYIHTQLLIVHCHTLCCHHYYVLGVDFMEFIYFIAFSNPYRWLVPCGCITWQKSLSSWTRCFSCYARSNHKCPFCIYITTLWCQFAASLESNISQVKK